MMKSVLITTTIAVVLMGCGRSDECDVVPSADDCPKNGRKAELCSVKRAAVTDDQIAVVGGLNQFSAEVHAALPVDHNSVTSPYTVAMVLSMAAAGAGGETRDQLLEGMHNPLEPAAYHRALGSLSSDLLSNPHCGFELRGGNAVYGKKGLKWKEDYLSTLSGDYGKLPQEADFSERKPEKEINEWVAAQTNDMIPDLLEPGILSAATQLVLVNAVYFRGEWLDPFPPGRTDRQTFHTPTGPVLPETMHLKSGFDFAVFSNASVLELPYKGDIVMDVFLPHEPDGLAALEADVVDRGFGVYLDELRNEGLKLQLPKWQSRAHPDLIPHLKNLGIVEPFGGADFSNIAAGFGGNITSLSHEAMIVVAEEGTEAAAAAAGEYADTGGYTEFVVDHPFLYVIRDTESGLILFIGRVTNPRVKG